MEDTVLLVIDMQNDFCKENSEYNKKGFPVSENRALAIKIQDVIKNTNMKIFFILSNYDGFKIKSEKCNFCLKDTSGAKSYIQEDLADEIIIKNSTL